MHTNRAIIKRKSGHVLKYMYYSCGESKIFATGFVSIVLKEMAEAKFTILKVFNIGKKKLTFKL